MTTIKTATASLPVSADALYAFLSDLSKHRAFLEPAAMNFQGEADRHSYIIEVMGMKMPQELVVKERVPGQRVVLVPGAKKMFDHELRFEIAPADGGCTLRLVDEADIPMMMAMMGAEKLLQGQLDSGLARIQELAGAGQI
ncbi:MAG TPA: SRPBCC family protein [Holophagaceae bacterium]|uniref:SRPBCC family protein n=1 Tax=Geothrix mesophila TaxID=2922723 RepID=UPI001FAD64CA|nr:SRPBCC family protein [Geothrix sp. SG198]HJU84640.1 SRPBCC family protein [Holophagaceae bacterium]HJV39411.1 SRPBCC family protein [Geothrix sp.]